MKPKRKKSQETKGQLYSSGILCHLQSQPRREGAAVAALPRICVWMEGCVSSSWRANLDILVLKCGWLDRKSVV